MRSRAVSVLREALYTDWQGLCRAFSWSCTVTAFSTILDRNLRLDTGLIKFLRSSGLRGGLLRRGVTCTPLSYDGTTPDVSERFTMLVIADRSTSACSIRSEVGMGSNVCDSAGDRRMILRGSSGVISENCVRSLCLGFPGISSREWTAMSSRCLRMSTFPQSSCGRSCKGGWHAKCCAEVYSGRWSWFLTV